MVNLNLFQLPHYTQISFHLFTASSQITILFKSFNRGTMGCVWVYMQKMELRYWWEYSDEKTRIN